MFLGRNQAQRIFWGAVLLAAALGLGACNKAEPVHSPQQQLIEDFYQAVARADAQQALAYWQLEPMTATEALMLQGNVQMLIAMRQEAIQANGGLQSVRLLQELPAQQQAAHAPSPLEVQVELLFHNGQTLRDTLHLVQVADGWRIGF
ncbi:MAG: hypothetical protein KIG95_00950 [Comamonas sp.]|nr:hypothetical protein [Comamonas sp.]